MPLIVGTDAYSSLINVRTFWSVRGGVAWSVLTDAAADILIRKATDWVDRSFEFIGEKASGTQRLKWPRTAAAIESFEIASTAIPWQVEEATALVADMYRLGTFDMEGIVTSDASAISMKKVDVITIQYDTSNRLVGGSVPSHVFEVLRPLIRGLSGSLKRA